MGEEIAADANKENPVNESEEKEPEDKVNVFLEYFACSTSKNLCYKKLSYNHLRPT